MTPGADACPCTTRKLEQLQKRSPSPLLYALAAAWALLNLACFDPNTEPPAVPVTDPTQEPKPIARGGDANDARALAIALGFVILL
jgi:hypothetical protein